MRLIARLNALPFSYDNTARKILRPCSHIWMLSGLHIWTPAIGYFLYS